MMVLMASTTSAGFWRYTWWSESIMNQATDCIGIAFCEQLHVQAAQ